MFASYFDVRDLVPESVKDETGEFALIGAEELRQDPQSGVERWLSLLDVPCKS